MTFVFWGLFLVLGLIALGYYCWMVWLERSESSGDGSTDRPEGS
jgi:hypothetical protein